MADTGPITASTIIKLVVWSLIVGVLLYWLKISPGDIYAWVGNKLAGVWDWMSESGLTYLLLGATIVIPVFLISRLHSFFRRR